MSDVASNLSYFCGIVSPATLNTIGKRTPTQQLSATKRQKQKGEKNMIFSYCFEVCWEVSLKYKHTHVLGYLWSENGDLVSASHSSGVKSLYVIGSSWKNIHWNTHTEKERERDYRNFESFSLAQMHFANNISLISCARARHSLTKHRVSFRWSVWANIVFDFIYHFTLLLLRICIAYRIEWVCFESDCVGWFSVNKVN